MAFGTIAFDTLQTSDSKKTGTNKTLDTSFVVSGGTLHYVNYDAVSQTTDDSLNQSSLTDVSTGEFYSTFTNAMDSATSKAHWVSCINSNDDGANDVSGAIRAGTHACIGMNDNHRALSASEVSFASYFGAHATGNGALDDLSMTCCMTKGTLA